MNHDHSNIKAVSNKSQAWYLCFISLVVSLGAIWQVWEVDLYWMVRAGNEILTSFRISQVETWSYSVVNEPWLNTHWLSEVISALIFGLGQEKAIIAARVVSVWYLTYAFLKILSKNVSGKYFFLMIASLLFYFSIWFRMAFRADQLVLMCFAFMVVSEHSSRQSFVYSHRHFLKAFLVLLATQFHAGASVTCLALALVYTFVDDSISLRQKVLWTCLYCVLFVSSPVGFGSLSFILDHLFYDSHRALQNHDHQPIGWHHFTNDQSFLFAGLTWLALNVISWIGSFGLLMSKGSLWYRLNYKQIVLGAFGAGLFFLSINRDRFIPYQLLFMAPMIGFGLVTIQSFLSKLLLKKREEDYVQKSAIMVGLWSFAPYVMGFVCSLVLAGHSSFTAYRYPWTTPQSPGWGPDHLLFPVTTTDFLRKERPEGNIYHTFTYGAYLVHYLMDYRLYGDTRETPFTRLNQEYLEAYRSPVAAKRLYEKYRINTLLMPIPRMGPSSDQRTDIVEEYNPSSEWAIVAFDEHSLVVLRRTAGNSDIIARHEYRILKPHLSPELYVSLAGRTAQIDQVFLNEIERCLNMTQKPSFCIAAKKSFLQNQR